MADILIPEFMDEGAVAGLKADYDVHWDAELWGNRDDLIAQIAGARAIISTMMSAADLSMRRICRQ